MRTQSACPIAGTNRSAANHRRNPEYAVTGQSEARFASTVKALYKRKHVKARKFETVAHNSVFAWLGPMFCHRTTRLNKQKAGIDSDPGGIAQLVERQLCKLDVRGSNPLAST